MFVRARVIRGVYVTPPKTRVHLDAESNVRNVENLHVHLAPFAPVGGRRLPFVRAGHAAAGTATARAVVFVGMVRGRGRAAGDVGKHERRLRGRGVAAAAGRRGGDAQRRQQRLAHGHRGERDGADRQRDGPRGEHRGAVQRGRGERGVQHALADVSCAAGPALVLQRRA